MSSTFSELAARGLIAALGAQPESDRYLVTSTHGEDLADVFRAILAQAQGTRTFHAGPGAPSEELKVLEDAGGTVIVPYLVQDPPPAKLRENRGSQGFASALRDHYTDAAGAGERMMLLVFDATPNETLVTTMNQGIPESALGLLALLDLALAPPPDAPQGLVRTAGELRDLAAKYLSATLGPQVVGRAAQAVNELAEVESNEEVGRQLYRLPWCLSDPDLFQHSGPKFIPRLREGIKHRQQLEAWAADPSTDFDAEARKTYSPEAAAKIVGARTGPVIAWEQFTVTDLVGGTAAPPPDDVPGFADLPVTIASASAWKLLAGGATLAAQIPGPGCTFQFHLTAPLTGQSTIHLIGFEGEEAPFTPVTLAKLTAAAGGGTDPVVDLSKLLQPRPGWSFMEAVLTKGGRLVKTPLASVRIALSIKPDGEVHVYEADGKIDLEAQAYSAEEQLTFIGEQDGEQVFARPIRPPESEFGELADIGEGSFVPAVQGDAPEELSDELSTESPEHLAIEAWARETLPPGGLAISLRERPGGVVVADIGPVSAPVTTSGALSVSRWSLERYVIEHPRTTAFRLIAGVVAPDEHLEDLELGGLAEPFSAFLDAREAFFSELSELPVPSVLGINLATCSTVRPYVSSYEDLLAAVPDNDPGQLGYDRIVLPDAFRSESGEIFVAPTSPLTVALHLQLQENVREWVSTKPGGNYFPGDASLISAQYLVPYLRLHTVSGTWLESGYAPYPWRRYLPFAHRAQRERHPWLSRYIARRIERFLDVHPSYADERRTLRLAFINPGPARHVRDALLSLVGTSLKRRQGEALRQLPAFELQLLADEHQTADSPLGSDLDLFMSLVPEDGQPSDAAMEVMKRLSYTKGSAAEFFQDPKSFAHLTFVEDYFRPREELVEWPSHEHPSSMYLSGLATDTERLAASQPAAIRFLSAAWTGGRQQQATGRIAARTSEIAAAAAGVPVKPGIVRAADVVVARSQIPQLYDRAVWVVHIDRHVGLELFAPQDSGSGAPYILDYTDQETPEPSVFDGITATSQVAPYQARIADVLGEAVAQQVPQEAAERLLRTLNLISGRWGLEMLRTSDNMLRGRLATALAAQVIEQSEGLHGDPSTLSLVIALDELLRVTGGEGLPLKQGWAAKLGIGGGGSDDLLILTVPLGEGRPKLNGRLVEVKYRSAKGASAEEAAEQLKKTHALITQLLVSDREPGRSFQGRHLAKLILRYASRHVAYGLLSAHPAVTAGTEAVSRIGSGDYDLDLATHRSGKALLGDYVSVEPELTDGMLTPQVAAVAGTEIGRIRIGRPVVEAMLKTGLIPGVAAAMPGEGESDEGPSHQEPRVEGDSLQSGNEAPETSSPDADDAAVVIASGGTAGAVSTEKTEPSVPQVAQAPSRFDLPENELRALGSQLDDVLVSYNLPVQPVQPGDAVCGPNTVRFRVRMARGGTIAQVEARERDIMRELGLEKPLMIGQDAQFVTLDVPRARPVEVTFGDLAASLRAMPRARGELPVAFGVDLAGAPQTEDLAQLPHLLVAGSTGSGKSVFLASLLGSLVMLPPEEVEIVLVDVKGLDFAPFASLAHLRQPPIGSADEALAILDQLYATERAHRMEVLASAGAQSILDYYTRLGGTDLKQIVIMIDEFSNLLGGDKATGTKLEDTIQQYAEIMRSFGIYLVIATQRPSADIVTGRIKANLPARCAFRLPTHSDSMTILGRKGAEQLLGRGDMLFYRDGLIERLQAPFTTAQDVLDAAART